MRPLQLPCEKILAAVQELHLIRCSFRRYRTRKCEKEKAPQTILVRISQAVLASLKELQRRRSQYCYHFCKIVPIVVSLLWVSSVE